jgi:hypothetical protein
VRFDNAFDDEEPEARASTVTSCRPPESEAHQSVCDALTELLTWQQICERFPTQWVALVDMDWNEETNDFTVARVAGHGTTRRAPFEQMRATGLSYETVGHFYTGRVRPHAIDFVRRGERPALRTIERSPRREPTTLRIVGVIAATLAPQTVKLSWLDNLRADIAARMKHMCWIVMLLGCASTARETTLSRANVGTKYARQTAYFASCGTRCDEEQTRGGIRHDAILDEIVLAKVDAGETCFDVTIRSEESKDEPLAVLGAQCTIDGGAQASVIESEAVSVFDHAYTGQQNVAVVEGVAASQYIGMAISKPTDLVFRVIERRGRVCCGRGAAQSASLEFHNKHYDYGVSKGRLQMRWQLAN